MTLFYSNALVRVRTNHYLKTPPEILRLAASGLQQKGMAEQLYISPQTIKKHLQNIYKKLGATNKIEALRKAGIL
ncbi:MAG: response regulator transcription factor [Chitinophagaceae bacterium]